MAKSIVTPTDLREFATILQKNIEEFMLIENSMNEKLNNYEWRDDVAMKFKADFEATKEPLNKLRQQMEEFIPYLTDKANILGDEYLGSGSGNVNFGAFATAGGATVAGVTVGEVVAGMKKGNVKDTPNNSGANTSDEKKPEGNTTKEEVELRLGENTKANISAEETKTGAQPSKGTVKGGIEYELDEEDTKVNASIESSKTEGGTAKGTAKAGVEHQFNKDTKANASVEASKEEGKPAKGTAKIGVEHQFSEDTKANASVEASKEEGKPAKGTAKIGVEKNLSESTKLSASGEMSKIESQQTNYTAKLNITRSFGHKPTPKPREKKPGSFTLEELMTPEGQERFQKAGEQLRNSQES